jgi:hypothetical protein
VVPNIDLSVFRTLDSADDTTVYILNTPRSIIVGRHYSIYPILGNARDVDTGPTQSPPSPFTQSDYKSWQLCLSQTTLFPKATGPDDLTVIATAGPSVDVCTNGAVHQLPRSLGP